MFGLLIVFGMVEGAVTTWLTIQFNRIRSYESVSIRDRIRFLAFTSWSTVAFSFIYLLLFVHSASTGSALTSVFSHLIFLGFTWILWTAGAGSLTSSLGGGINCTKVQRNVVYCNQLNAAEGFAWIEWLLTTFLLAVICYCWVRGSRRGEALRGLGGQLVERHKVERKTEHRSAHLELGTTPQQE
ncbi:hypothetical protein CPB86DRAFT_786817 [Serendipita vermifera]|nr:hypothetical protein CPB86DRAFT_786817 [Serendipita vermifera]